MKRLVLAFLAALAVAVPGQAQTYSGTTYPSSGGASYPNLTCTVDVDCTFTAPILASNGTSAAPSFSFTNDPDTGFYRQYTGLIGISVDDTKLGAFTATAIRLGNARQYAWSSDPVPENATPDTGLARSAAGVVKITDGSTGYGDLRLSANIYQAASGQRIQLDGATEIYFRETSNPVSLNLEGQVKFGTIGAPDIGLARNAAGVIRATDGSTGIKGFMGGGAAVASATAMPVPTGRVFHVTGTTSITSITSTNFASGAVITLIFDDVLTFTDGNNLSLAGNFVTTAGDTITLAFDGTNWYETSRSVN